MSVIEETPRAAWYAWTFEATRNEAPRSRYYFVSFTTYPKNTPWMKDLILDAAALARFDHGIHSKQFFILMFATQPKARYNMEVVGAFKIQVKDGDLKITRALMSGPDSKELNYEWKYNDDPYNFPSPPPLVPAPTDPMTGPLFPGGSVHLQYPVVKHSSHKHLTDRAVRFYPARTKSWYQGVSSGAKIHGMPIPASITGQPRSSRSRRSKKSPPPV